MLSVASSAVGKWWKPCAVLPDQQMQQLQHDPSAQICATGIAGVKKHKALNCCLFCFLMYARAHTHTHMYVRTHAHTHTHTFRLHTYTHRHMHLIIIKYKYAHFQFWAMNMHIFIFLRLCVCVCVCVCVICPFRSKEAWQGDHSWSMEDWCSEYHR